METKREESDQESGRRDGEDRTVTARSRRAALSRFGSGNPSPPPPMPFFHRRRFRKKGHTRPEGMIELIDIDSRYSFSDGEGPTKIRRSATPMLDVSSADERHEHHRVLEPIPPLPTWPSVWAVPSVPVTMALGSTTTTVPVTPTKGGATLLSRIGVVKKWGVRRWKGGQSTPSEVIGTLLLIFHFFRAIF